MQESVWKSKRENIQLPILLQVLQQDISRVTRKPYGQINYDAKACYDRILPNLTSIVSGSFGVSPSIVKLHHHLLQNMNYVVTVWKFIIQQITQYMALEKTQEIAHTSVQ